MREHTPAAITEPRFEVAGAGFAVNASPLLEGIDLTLEPGRLYGLIGHNGSGKTTLLKLLARQQVPTAGKIEFAGAPLARWSQRDLARRVGYLAQRPPEATGLTVRELAALGRYPWHGAVGRFRGEDRRHVDEALALTGMDAFAERLVDSLSGGERQRAWLAMLVAQNSDCMLLDEPIAALDVAHQMEVMERVRRLCHERGLTAVAVLHDVNIAARFCDEIVALHSGRRVAQGSPAEVVSPAVLEHIYGVPMGVVHTPEHTLPISYVA
jgi:iron complex transport system ATP-binding protein